MHVLIADDEAPARAELRFILSELMPDAQVYEAKDGEQALALLSRKPVDVAFLDIRMPGKDGLEVAAALLEEADPPLIVFATAYDAHALEAFDLAALDYVVKPFDERRLARTVERLRRSLAERQAREQGRAALRAFLNDRTVAGAPGPARRLWGERENGARVSLELGQVLWLEAKDKRVYCITQAGEQLRLKRSLKQLEADLPSPPFARVHRAYIVNLDHTAEVAPWFAGGWRIRMADAEGTRIEVSRRYTRRLKQQGLWG